MKRNCIFEFAKHHKNTWAYRPAFMQVFLFLLFKDKHILLFIKERLISQASASPCNYVVFSDREVDRFCISRINHFTKK